MARARRRAGATVRRQAPASTWNLELAGIAALSIALLLALALALPTRSGALGAATVHGLRVAFGGAAWLAPLAIALVGAIVFLEINVPRLIGTLGTAALLYFLIVCAAFGSSGGFVGTILALGLRRLVGPLGATLLLWIFALLVTVWITNVSVKRAIGWCIVLGLRVRDYARALSSARPRAPKVERVPGPGSLREAFGVAGTRSTAGSALAPIAPVDVRTFVRQEEGRNAAPDDPEDGEYGDEDEEEDEEFEDEDDVDDDFDEEYGDNVDDDHDELAAPPALAGEYEPAGDVTLESPRRTYRLPDLSMFDPPMVQANDDSSRAHVLEDTLASFGVGAKVTHIERGPSITRYELRPERGIKISRISALADDIALALAATSVRIEAPIPGKSAVGIEVPNATVSVVAVREILEALPHRGQVPPLNMALGKDITGRPVFGDLGKMPHLLVAGATGSGKSVCLNCIIASLLVCATPDQVQLLMIDPKRVELAVYNGIPHLIKEVITDPRLAAGALFEMTKEMDSRYERFAKAGVRKIEEYNAKYPEEKLPYVVIVIDELADLMMIAPAKVETLICRIAQLARATGIHLVVATQRPSVDVITGIIKANIPSRIAFAVSSQVDSRTILDMVGAERLLGRGDMLYLPIDAPKPVRSQGALITGAEVSRLVDFWAKQ
ncbi:MAG: DNA translocase FtsK, partial [Candidatus Baltobacteraceae bacterium]